MDRKETKEDVREKLGLEKEPNSFLREKPKKKYGKKRKRL